MQRVTELYFDSKKGLILTLENKEKRVLINTGYGNLRWVTEEDAEKINNEIISENKKPWFKKIF